MFCQVTTLSLVVDCRWLPDRRRCLTSLRQTNASYRSKSAGPDLNESNTSQTCPSSLHLLLLLLLVVRAALRLSKEGSPLTNGAVMSRCRHSSPPTARISAREHLLARTGGIGSDHLKLKWCGVAPWGAISQLNSG